MIVDSAVGPGYPMVVCVSKVRTVNIIEMCLQ